MSYRTTDQMVDHQMSILRSQTKTDLELHSEAGRYFLMSNGYSLGHHEKKGDFYSSLFMANQLLSHIKKA